MSFPTLTAKQFPARPKHSQLRTWHIELEADGTPFEWDGEALNEASAVATARDACYARHRAPARVAICFERK